MNINEVFKVALKSGESARLATEKKDVSEETRITISKPFSDEWDTVLDPFMGSGTTIITAQQMKRNSIGIEIKAEYLKLVKSEISCIVLGDNAQP